MFWEEEYIGRQCRRKARSREDLWESWLERLQKPSSSMEEMVRSFVLNLFTFAMFTFFPTMNSQVLGGKTAHSPSALVLVGGGEGG